MKKFKLHYIGLFLLLIISSCLRFSNLSYSEFQDDEKKAQIRLFENERLIEFLLRQRKGPMQFLVAQIPFSIFSLKGEVNELAVRLPFTTSNLISVFVLYALIYKITKSHGASLIASSIYSVNGFVVGFSRIAQYQSLNLLFSFLSLYYFADLKYRDRGFRLPILLGTIFASLSLLSHWDAIFYIVPTLYFFITFVLHKNVTKKEKLVCLFISFITFAIIVFPFIIAYLLDLSSNQTGNIDYFFKRIGTAGSSFLRHKYIFELYNPEVALWLYIVGLLSAVLFIKRTGLFLLWFMFNLLLIKFFMVTPKTHIYNYVIPAVITSSLGFYYFCVWLKSRVKLAIPIFLLMLTILIGLLIFQSYLIFVDHKKEYPFDEKKILWHLNPVLYDEEIITFGFPHNRGWKEVNKYIDPQCQYITNESKGISQIYVKASYGYNEKCCYVVVIKRPFYTKAQDAIYAGTKKSKLVYKYVKDGETLTKVYKMKGELTR
ncbi:MAG: phospholipid carrier-dependent glycosyltransferase [Patescibacteria group bacterium]